MPELTFTYQQLFDFSKTIFKKTGCNDEDADIAVRALLAADLRGIDSHGVARLSGYIRLCEAGRTNSNPQIKIIHETPSTAVVDGHGGFGLVVAQFAMNIAIKKAIKLGTGWVSVQNSNHFGIAAHHAMLALQNEMIGIAMTNASAFVAPTFSVERLLGTNPICVAIPAGEEPPFVADFSTTTAANGKLEILQRKNQKAPVGWLQDKEGNNSTDPDELKNGGALLPLGGDKEHGSHKGYALGAIVDIFSGILSGANYGPWVPPFPAYAKLPDEQPGKGIGHFFGAMRIDAFRPADEFKMHMDKWIKKFRSAKTMKGQEKVLIHGDIEREMEEVRKKNGIPLHEKVVTDLEELGKKYEISFPD